METPGNYVGHPRPIFHRDRLTVYVQSDQSLRLHVDGIPSYTALTAADWEDLKEQVESAQMQCLEVVGQGQA